MEKISFVIPCYKSVDTLHSVVQEIEETMLGQEGYDYEILLVNDCSPDKTWDVISQLADSNKKINGINLAKNFGQHAALMAGFRYATGDIIVSLDDDAQTPANEVMKLIEKLHGGYDVVYARYKRNQESAFRRFGSWVNKKMAESLIDVPKGLAIQSYFAAKRFIIDEILRYENAYPYIFGLVFRATQNVGNVEVNHRKREIGTTGYTFKKLIGLWMNGFTAFSVKPLRWATLMGLASAFLGFVIGVWSIINKFLSPNVPVGYSSLIATISFFCGLLMLMLGLIGEYIGRIYICLNRSPQYVIKDVKLQNAEKA